MTKWSVSEIPSYLKPLCVHFDYDKAREYFRIYSYFINVNGLYDFSNSGVEADLRDDFRSFTMTYLLELACKIYDYSKDPYSLKPQVAELLRAIGRDSTLLSKHTKKYFRLYTSPKLWKYAWVISFYEQIKSIERKFRRWRRSVFRKS